MGNCVRFRVSGRVQGVWFRASTHEQAAKLGLDGWVRNLANGDVEVLACGNEVDIEALADWLWRGPRQAKVSRVERVSSNDSVPRGFSVADDA